MTQLIHSTQYYIKQTDRQIISTLNLFNHNELVFKKAVLRNY